MGAVLPPLPATPRWQQRVRQSLICSPLCPSKVPNPSGSMAPHHLPPIRGAISSSRTLAGASGCTQGVRGKKPPSLLSSCLWVQTVAPTPLWGQAVEGLGTKCPLFSYTLP